jgi:hypothetical protein
MRPTALSGRRTNKNRRAESILCPHLPESTPQTAVPAINFFLIVLERS